MHIRFDDEEEDVSMAAPAAPAPSTSCQMASCSSAARVDFEFSDPCYVFRAIRSPDCSHVAASLSNGNIKTYSCSTAALVAVGDLAGAHGAPTSDIAFPLADSAHALYSCSRDGMIKGWDLRAMQQAEQ
jgi:hypothetical protein